MVTIGVIRINPAMLKRDEKDLTKPDIMTTIVDFKNSPSGKLDWSKLSESPNFEGSVPFRAVVSFSAIIGATVISLVSWSIKFTDINTAKGAKIRTKINEINQK